MYFKLKLFNLGSRNPYNIHVDNLISNDDLVSLMKTPLTWLSKWDGPEDPMHYLRGLVARAIAVQSWVEKAESGRLLHELLDLSDLFHPDTFLNALRQQTAR